MLIQCLADAVDGRQTLKQIGSMSRVCWEICVFPVSM